jgi:hypothetical protein
MANTLAHCFNCYFVDVGVVLIFFSSGPEGEFEPDPDRNFQDPAFTNFQESAQVRSIHHLIPRYGSPFPNDKSGSIRVWIRITN